MVTRAILLVAFAAFLLVEIVRADDAPTLPSRKASVVLQILKFTPQEPSKNALDQIETILGKADADMVDQLGNLKRETRFYILDDKSEIVVCFLGGELTGIAFCSYPQRQERDLYTPPKRG